MKYSLIVTYAFLFFAFNACVSTKVFNDLEARYAVVKTERNAYEKSRDSLQQSWDLLNSKLGEVEMYLSRSRDSVAKGLQELKDWEEKYTLLKENSEEKIQNSIAANNALLKEIALRKTRSTFFFSSRFHFHFRCFWDYASKRLLMLIFHTSLR